MHMLYMRARLDEENGVTYVPSCPVASLDGREESASVKPIPKCFEKDCALEIIFFLNMKSSYNFCA